jgi:8-oxo-dGTP pyrophosphatase MutT (NUDIX family)
MNRLLYTHRWITLREGLHGEAYIDAGSGVAVVPLLDSGLVNLIVETSYVDGSRCIGIPMGTVESGESLEASARRELAEETALQARAIQYIGNVNPLQRYSNLVLHVFLANAVPGDSLKRDEPYEIENLPTSWDEIERMVQSGALADASTISALFIAKTWLSRGAA